MDRFLHLTKPSKFENLEKNIGIQMGHTDIKYLIFKLLLFTHLFIYLFDTSQTSFWISTLSILDGNEVKSMPGWIPA